MTDKPAVDPGSLRFQDYERLTHALTRKLCGWVAARDRSGATPSYEDIFQDLAMVWVQCRDRFDPTRGVMFSTYFTRAALNQWQRLAKQINQSRHTVSMDEPMLQSADYTLAEAVGDPDQLSPEDVLAQKEWVEQLMQANPLLARLVELSASPPEDLRDELAALEAQREWALSQGIETLNLVPAAFTPQLLSRTFNFNWRHRAMMQDGLSEG